MRRETFRPSVGLVTMAALLLLAAATQAQEPLNQPPEGFVALFNGKDLTGWKGLLRGPYDNPDRRAALDPEKAKELQQEADENMRAHWKAVDGILVFDGKGRSLCTAKDYGDFEMLVDWKIEKGGDSGIYLRGSPQVQIWDTALRNVGAQVGSGGLYNNQENPSKPSKVADKPVGEWNTFRIIMVGEKVTIYLNDELVVDNIVLENYWDRKKPIYPTGQIELQNHGNFLYFRNIYIREILSAQEKLAGFAPLFNGRDMTGWTGNTNGYYAQDGKMICDPKKAGGNVYTVDEYSDFTVRFEFKLTPGANNGLGLRAPLTGDAAYEGMEIQILEDSHPKYAKLQPYQFHGSVYGTVPAKRDCLKPIAEWNYEEVTVRGRQITVKVNGKTIVDADLDQASTPETMDHRKHPGLKREKGHIGFCGHGDYLEFRNIRVRTLDKDSVVPPEGFAALFNGKDLTGWKGLLKGPYDNPDKRAALSPQERAKLQQEADENMRAHWKVVDGVLTFDGKGRSLCTAKDYGDFEMLVDWKIEKNGDSGIYLRGSPQVQIWDTGRSGAQVGSGGLYNNKVHPSKPTKCADKPVGEWNTFRITMIGDRVTVILNDELVVDNVIMENYWDRSKPIFPTGQIELQNHGNFLYFRNVFLREIPREKGTNQLTAEERNEGFVSLFNGTDLAGWSGGGKSYFVRDGLLVVDPSQGSGSGGNLCTDKEYGDFIFRFEFRLTPGANNGIGIRVPKGGHASAAGMEIQILDHDSPRYRGWLKDYQHHGSIYGVVPAKTGYLKPVGEWNCEEIAARGKQITVTLNGTTIVDADLEKAATAKNIDLQKHPGLLRTSGQIGFCGHGDYLEFRNIRIKSLDPQ